MGKLQNMDLLTEEQKAHRIRLILPNVMKSFLDRLDIEFRDVHDNKKIGRIYEKATDKRFGNSFILNIH